MFSKGHSDPIHFSTFLSFIIQELGFWVWGWERERSGAERVCTCHYVTISGLAPSHWDTFTFGHVGTSQILSPFCLFLPLLSSLSSKQPRLLPCLGRHWVCHFFMMTSKTHHYGLMRYGEGRWTGARPNDIFWRLLITQGCCCAWLSGHCHAIAKTQNVFQHIGMQLLWWFLGGCLVAQVFKHLWVVTFY